MTRKLSFRNERALHIATAVVAFTASTGAISQVDFDEGGEQLTLAGAYSDTRAIRFADMDTDGVSDVVVGPWGGSMRIWINDGSGTYTDSGFNEFGDANFVNWLLTEDFDGDGTTDVLAVRNGGQPSTLWFNDGTGNLTLSGQTFPNGSHAAAGDLDGDGNVDLVFRSGEVFVNDGSGQFSELVNLSAAGTVDIGDLDGDSHADILFAGASTGNVYINDGNTPPGFGPPSSQPVPGGRSTELVDLDGDADLDAVTNTGAYTNDGDANFSETQVWSGDVMEATTADVDQDGDLDIVLALRGPDFINDPDAPNEIWVNDGGATFSDSGLQLGNNRTGSVAFGDFDSDSDPDLIFGTSGSDYIYQHENTGDPWQIFADRFEEGWSSTAR